MKGVLVREIHMDGSDDSYYIVFKDERKIYKLVDEKEINVVKHINVMWCWYGKELNAYINDDYEMIMELKDKE